MMTADMFAEGANIQPNDLINQMAELEVTFVASLHLQGAHNANYHRAVYMLFWKK